MSNEQLMELIGDRFIEFEDEFGVSITIAVNQEKEEISFYLDLGFENLPIISEKHLLKIEDLIKWLERYLKMEAELLHKSKVGKVGLFFYFKVV